MNKSDIPESAGDGFKEDSENIHGQILLDIALPVVLTIVATAMIYNWPTQNLSPQLASLIIGFRQAINAVLTTLAAILLNPFFFGFSLIIIIAFIALILYTCSKTSLGGK